MFLILGNYQSHKGFVAIPIRPLTIFLGANSVGKTAILRALQDLRNFYQRGLDELWAEANPEVVIGFSLMIDSGDLWAYSPTKFDDDYMSRVVEYGPPIQQFFLNDEDRMLPSQWRERLTVIFETRFAELESGKVDSAFICTVLIGGDPFIEYRLIQPDEFYNDFKEASFAASIYGAKKWLESPKSEDVAEYIEEAFKDCDGDGGSYRSGDIHPSWTGKKEKSKRPSIPCHCIDFEPIRGTYQIWWPMSPPSIMNPASWLVDLAPSGEDSNAAVGIYWLMATFVAMPTSIFLSRVPIAGGVPVREIDPELNFHTNDGKIIQGENNKPLVDLASAWFSELKKHLPEDFGNLSDASDADNEARFGSIKKILADRKLFGASLDFGAVFFQESEKSFVFGQDPYSWQGRVRSGAGRLNMWLLVDGEQRSFNKVGSGIAQMLPIVLAAFSSSPEALQQPELHLHPALQGRMADVVIQGLAQKHGGRVIVETHSEHFVLRVVRRAMENARRGRKVPRIAPSDVALVFMQRSKAGTTCHLIEVGADGGFLDPWPDGFFEERMEDLAVLFEARAANDPLC